jgi:hypothetical protein
MEDDVIIILGKGLNMETELKTLKDFKIKNQYDYISFKDLKQEVIKWIKEIERGNCEEYEHYQGEVYGLIKWIRDFFNITKEDLNMEKIE